MADTPVEIHIPRKLESPQDQALALEAAALLDTERKVVKLATLLGLKLHGEWMAHVRVTNIHARADNWADQLSQAITGNLIRHPTAQVLHDVLLQESSPISLIIKNRIAWPLEEFEYTPQQLEEDDFEHSIIAALAPIPEPPIVTKEDVERYTPEVKPNSKVWFQEWNRGQPTPRDVYRKATRVNPNLLARLVTDLIQQSNNRTWPQLAQILEALALGTRARVTLNGEKMPADKAIEFALNASVEQSELVRAKRRNGFAYAPTGEPVAAGSICHILWVLLLKESIRQEPTANTTPVGCCQSPSTKPPWRTIPPWHTQRIKQTTLVEFTGLNKAIVSKTVRRLAACGFLQLDRGTVTGWESIRRLILEAMHDAASGKKKWISHKDRQESLARMLNQRLGAVPGTRQTVTPDQAAYLSDPGSESLVEYQTKKSRKQAPAGPIRMRRLSLQGWVAIERCHSCRKPLETHFQVRIDPKYGSVGLPFHEGCQPKPDGSDDPSRRRPFAGTNPVCPKCLHHLVATSMTLQQVLHCHKAQNRESYVEKDEDLSASTRWHRWVSHQPMEAMLARSQERLAIWQKVPATPQDRIDKLQSAIHALQEVNLLNPQAQDHLWQAISDLVKILWPQTDPVLPVRTPTKEEVSDDGSWLIDLAHKESFDKPTSLSVALVDGWLVHAACANDKVST